MENWGKLPIVVPKVAFLGTFGTTIGKYHLVPVAWSACARRMVCLCPSHGHPQPTLWASVARALGNYCP